MLWIKALHLIAMVCWFAGLFYLPRLFVYHAMAEDTTSQTYFKTMERKLYRGITTPAMIATLVFGIWLLSYNWQAYLKMGWIHAKLSLIVLLVIYHFICGYFVKLFQNNANKRNHTYYRIFNEIPVFLLLGIIILAVVRPF
ncbi:protoporphyrinogen oxidase HemJ [Zooshikella ganghwensis]|uniref:Protoporphyrinogen IX oxidase n=1 Tax=Zooshikella ganghwensis TaxID=202772 RepID=A0A4P9VQD1_9GAMM|nr:protoporphyrinogen oxidase HemJ [Zooshikella ganghwensis]RDH45723.1 protoporphyrinogen oxidase HemJ [Zooshikella ganghwensis]